MKKVLLVANWKSNPATLSQALSLGTSVERAAKKARGVEVVIAPPFPFLIPLRSKLKAVGLGAQNVFWSDGPYTGEVSPKQLASIGVDHVILGHSERRTHAGETSEGIKKKILASFAARLRPILCVGEHERTGRDVSAVVGAELRAALEGIPAASLARLTIAYEPVWAISSTPGAVADTPENAFRVKVYIRRILSDMIGQKKAESVRVIYGGSVSPANIRSFLTDGEMEGALIGSASLTSQSFSDIIRISSQR